MSLLNRFSLRARTSADGDRSIAFVLALLMAFVFAPVVLLHGFNHAYNARRQRVLGGVSPDEAVRRRLESNPRLTSRRYEPPSDPCVLPKALMIVEAAKDVSHPDT